MTKHQNASGDLNSLLNIHWFPIISQGNIYSMTKLCSSNGSNKILVASLKRRIFSCGYQRQDNKTLRALVKELLFTYIPSGAEIISIDCYNKQHFNEDFVIGVTIIKQSSEGTERYLNIYSESTGDSAENAETSIETIAQNCLTVELTYTPYFLYHTIIRDETIEKEVVWLISGSDKQLHMIREDSSSHGYTEFPIDKYFPELVNIQALVLWINVYYYDNGKRRLTAIACESGLVKITLIDVDHLQVVKEWKLRYDKPITNLRIFSQYTDISDPFADHSSDLVNKSFDPNPKPTLNILIVTALDPCVVFMDVLNKGLKRDVTLKLETTDCILSSCIADINMDGINEILLGTYAKEVVSFSFIDNYHWKLTDKRKFDSAVYSMCYLDLTGDGVKELVVLTQKGVYILQHDPESISQIWKQRLQQLIIKKQSKQSDDDV